jgi:hypothetical protein
MITISYICFTCIYNVIHVVCLYLSYSCRYFNHYENGSPIRGINAPHKTQTKHTEHTTCWLAGCSGVLLNPGWAACCGCTVLPSTHSSVQLHNTRGSTHAPTRARTERKLPTSGLGMTVLDSLEHRRKLVASFARFRITRMRLGHSPFLRAHVANKHSAKTKSISTSAEKMNNYVFCYLEPEVRGSDQNSKLSRIVIQLYTAECPATCENFRVLCTGERGYGYRHTSFHRVEPEFVVQAGKVGRSMFGGNAVAVDSTTDNCSDTTKK